MGMVSGVLVLMGFAKVRFFMTFGPFVWDHFFPTVVSDRVFGPFVFDQMS